MSATMSARVNVEVTIETNGTFQYSITSSSSKVKITDGKNIDIKGLSHVAVTFLLTNTGGVFTGFNASSTQPSPNVGWTPQTTLNALGVKPLTPWPPADPSALSFELDTAPKSVVSYSLFAQCPGRTAVEDPKIYNDPDPVTIASQGFRDNPEGELTRATRPDAFLGLKGYLDKLYPMLKKAYQRRASRH